MSETAGQRRYRVCVVCSGNICRSPMGEVVLRHRLAEAELGERVEVDSAGTGDWHVGDPADPRTLTAITGLGLDGSAHRAAQLLPPMLAERDLVLVADRGHLRHVERMARESGVEVDVRLFRSFDPDAVAAGTLELDDPYFGGAAEFTRCAQEVSRACDGIVRHVRDALA